MLLDDILDGYEDRRSVEIAFEEIAADSPDPEDFRSQLARLREDA